MPTKYVQIKLKGHGGYVQPRSELMQAIDAELDSLDEGTITLTFDNVIMTDEEYSKLPEFTGH